MPPDLRGVIDQQDRERERQEADARARKYAELGGLKREYQDARPKAQAFSTIIERIQEGVKSGDPMAGAVRDWLIRNESSSPTAPSGTRNGSFSPGPSVKTVNDLYRDFDQRLDERLARFKESEVTPHVQAVYAERMETGLTQAMGKLPQDLRDKKEVAMKTWRENPNLSPEQVVHAAFGPELVRRAGVRPAETERGGAERMPPKRKMDMREALQEAFRQHGLS